MDSELQHIADKVRSGRRIDDAEALALWRGAPLWLLGDLADGRKRAVSGDKVYYNRNFHIEPTNRCVFNCRFCSYRRPKGDPEAWDYSMEEIEAIARAHAGQGMTEVHIVGGVHPDHDLDYYVEMIRSVKAILPEATVKAFTAIELSYMIRRAGLSLEEGLRRLREAGMEAIPGGGAEIFDEEYVAVAQGGREVNTLLFGMRWDVIFFTGSPALGRIVMTAAARNLTPVVLELGGKSPSIVDRGADIEVAARRIAWGKTLNAGQTCIAPDYLLIHRSLQDEFSRAFARALHRLHGDDAQQSLHYGRLVNDRAFERVTSYLAQEKILVGGRTDPSDRYIEPTLLAEVDPGAPVMQEEIFGPVLPMLPFDDIGEAVALINDREKPLALYYFGPEKTGREVLLHTSSGGACINDTIMQIANDRLPFGGVGNSGMGRYHGRDSFDAFSHRRGVVESPARPDLPLRYPPYKGFRWVKKIL